MHLLTRGKTRHGHEKIVHAALHNDTMEIERVNAIGTLLADLSARTAALRGYL